MLNFIFAWLCICCAWGLAEEGDSDFEPLEIAFDDFPDNSIPELSDHGLDAIYFKAYNSSAMPKADEIASEQIGISMYAFPDALVDGCVNVITGDFQETALDFSLPGSQNLNMQRYYCGSGARKGSLLYGWQMSHGAKLLWFESKHHYRAFIKGGDRHGIQYKQLTSKREGISIKDIYAYLPLESFFVKGITNCALGAPGAGTNLKNDRLYQVNQGFELLKADQSRYQFTKSSHDPEREKHTHGYRLEKSLLPSGSAYAYSYSMSFGMPILIEQLNRRGAKIAEIKLKQIPTTNAFKSNPELTYMTPASEELKYRFQLYGQNNHKAILTEVQRPSQPAIKYSYELLPGHKTKRRLSQRELPDGRLLRISYSNNGKVHKLLAPAGANQELVPVQTFKYSKHGYTRTAEVINALGGLKTYSWDSYEKRLLAKTTFDCHKNPILVEKFTWGSVDSDRSHLTARILESGTGELLSYQSFAYDPFGNVITEAHYGNFTGRCSRKLSVSRDLKSLPSGQLDVLEKRYAYDHLQRKVLEDDGRLLQRFTYVEDTNLVSAHYTAYAGRNRRRCLYRYSASGAECQKIVDDGAAEEPDDLSFVTERHITATKNTLQGLPEVTRKYALDLETGKRCLLRKSVNTYDAHGWRIAESVYDSKKELAYTREWQYDSHGNVIYAKDALGAETRAQYDANDNLIFEQKPDLAARYLTYDRMNRLVLEEARLSRKLSLFTRYRYDLAGNCISLTNINEQETSYQYDVHGRLLASIHSAETNEKPTMRYARNAMGAASSITDALGATTTVEYNLRGQPALITHPDGTSEKHFYTLWGELAESIACDGTRLCYTYDALGREIKSEWFDAKNALVKSCSKEYSAFHLITETDGNGIRTHYTYDIAGRLATKRIKNNRITYEYDTLGRQEQVTHHLEEGNISYIQKRDFLDRVVESYTLNPGNTILQRQFFYYDAQGRETLREEWNQAGKAATETKYDRLGRIIRKTDALGYSTHTAYYQGISPQEEVTDPFGIKTLTTFNPFGQPLQERRYDPFGSLVEETEHAYDLKGNYILRHIKTAESSVETVWKYDSMGRLKSKIEGAGTADERCTRYTYDAVGNLTTLTKNDGVILHYTYDALGRKIALRSSDQSISYVYSYDSNGNLLSAEDKIHATSFKRIYDICNQLKEEKLPFGHVLTYKNDRLGRLKQLSLPGNAQVTYHYDGILLSSIERTGSLNYAHAYLQHDAAARPTSMRLPANAGMLSHEYDLLARHTNMHARHWQETLSYTFQRLQHRTVNDNFGAAASSYTYDARNQLTSETGVAEHVFEYDLQGNLHNVDGKSRQFSACNALLQAGEHKYSYDLNGNRIADSENSYSYDALDRLIAVTSKKKTHRYIYDAIGRRIASTHGDKTIHYLWQKEQEIGALSEDSEVLELRILDPMHQAVAMELQESLYVPLHDAFGNVRALLDAAGTCAATYRYSAFGAEQVQGDALAPWRYAGKRFDVETGFIYFGKRFYDPKTLCWLTPDPIGDVDGPNRYAYVHNNPLLYIDPNGHFAFAIPFTVTLFEIAWGAAMVEVAVLTAPVLAATVAGCAAAWAVNKAVVYMDNATENPPKATEEEDKPPYNGERLGNDPTQCPQEGFEWKGRDPPGGRGNWYNEQTGESLNPDLDHPPQ